LLFVLVENIETVYGKISYPSNYQRLDGIPTYCIISPTGTTLQEQSELLKLASTGVSAWNYELTNYEKFTPERWEVKSKIISNGDSTAGCDITINFIEKSDKESDKGFTVLGTFYHASKSIDVAFKDLNLGLVYNIMIHEIGHSLALGHYTSDDNDENNKFYSSKIFSPSIMIPTMNNNPSMMSIMEVDVQKIREIYGLDGFYAFSSESPPTSLPTPTPVPKPEPKPIIPLRPIESISITENNILISKYETKYVKIIGQIKDSIYHQGNPVYIVIKSPDDFVVHKIRTTQTGYFELPLVFDGNSKKGWYEVEASYLGHTDMEMNFQFNVGSTIVQSIPQVHPIPESKPSTLANTQSGKYLENISISSQNNDYTITSNLSTKIDSMVSLRINAENECPTKKEIFQKDFMFSPGKKVSFSFYQLDKGKPNACYIHFTISDFNGKILEKIILNYKIENLIQKNNSLELHQTQKIPEWIKKNAKWWSDGLIEDEDFLKGIQYLAQRGIIQVN